MLVITLTLQGVCIIPNLIVHIYYVFDSTSTFIKLNMHSISQTKTPDLDMYRNL